ncbi:hypothetical protein ISN40_10235 [Enterobacter asburiae]|uniref:hypothetical protein n=1 Tax=Enterobacter asburiae TaxID=61645 RepID=UPI0018877C06|nr:hypothetical protein [Enterobacter asburiae]MBF2790588.1 hypothetical protein [Enterobacter asburiae]
MAIFITLRCEGRGEGRSEFGKYRCWSDDNDDPYVLAGDTKKDAYLSLEDLFTDAKSAGWKRINGGWMCPNCIAYEAAAKGE